MRKECGEGEAVFDHLTIYYLTILPQWGGAHVGCLTAGETPASPVDARARTGSDYGFKFQVSSPDVSGGTLTAQPDCDVAENLQIIARKFGHVEKKP